MAPLGMTIDEAKQKYHASAFQIRGDAGGGRTGG
jgi:hypothetical protein